MLYEFEIAYAAEAVVSRLLGVQAGEVIVITLDTASDHRVATAFGSAVHMHGGKPMLVSHVCPATMGKSADYILPVDALAAVLRAADVWIELDSAGLMFTTPYDVATKQNPKLRHLCLGTADVDMLIRCIGRVNFDVMAQFEAQLIDILKEAKEVHITTPAGTDVYFSQKSEYPIVGNLSLLRGERRPGSYTLPGAIAWAPDLDSINGKIVFDGAVGVPAINLGVLKKPINLYVREGRIIKIEGGEEASRLECYLQSFDHPQALRLAHTGLGYNPGAITRCRFGNMLEDERIWGAVHWGIGEVSAGLIPGGQIVAPVHCDGSCLAASIEVDGEYILKRGEFVGPVASIAKQLKQTYRV
ncbi:MAG: hypothetical protein QXI12_03365 [Candidatus Methanomethyliaceae archaeon]